MEIEKGKWVISTYSQWTFGGCNWYDFTWINLETEWDKLLGGVELSIGLLGLHFRVRYNYTETETMAELKSMVDEIESGRASQEEA